MIKNPFKIMFWFFIQFFCISIIVFLLNEKIMMYYICSQFIFLTIFSMITLIIPCLKDLYKSAKKLDNKIKG